MLDNIVLCVTQYRIVLDYHPALLTPSENCPIHGDSSTGTDPSGTQRLVG